MGKTLLRNKEIPTFFGEVQLKGERYVADFENNLKPTIFYQHPHGRLWQGNSIEWLKSLKPESVDFIFADPPYAKQSSDEIAKLCCNSEPLKKSLSPGGIFVLETFFKFQLPPDCGWIPLRKKRAG